MKQVLFMLVLGICMVFLLSCSEAPSDPIYTVIPFSGLDDSTSVSDLPRLVELVTTEVRREADNIVLTGFAGRFSCNQLPNLEGEIYLDFGKKLIWSYRVAPALSVDVTIQIPEQVMQLRTQELSYLNLDPLDNHALSQIVTVVNTMTTVIEVSQTASDCILWITPQREGTWRILCESAIDPDFRGCEYLVNGVTGEIEVITPHD